MKSIHLDDGRKISFLHHVCEKENAPTIVFVHGFPLDHSMWAGQMPLREVASLIMPDLIGFGQSDQVSDGVSMQQLADDVAELLQQLGATKVIWCGLSMGGYVGWEFLKNHSEMLSGLVCCNTRATADDEKTARGRRVAAAQVVETGADPVAAAMREKLFSKSTLETKPEVVASVVDVIRSTAPATIAAAQLAMSKRSDFSELLPQIEVPVLVVAGEDDVITPANEMQVMAMEIPGSTFVELSEAGHMSPLERPEAFNHAVVHWIGQ
ncbi:alpha/beta fold hydrolase [Mariniblastus fucicola]|uniref:3-oxoadipate enol-lactonase 2 n=1 Tax=Mariniblastus fucicola TaxID=980251 RepID=A0A5B9PFG3_9BACT|nr:alpha/beta fold hydrolase [Mariniblastus fucicola]QEG24289.1 3-oxoadipate enol-lactonase 2 [Mariniblastus fucicola]